MQRQTSAPEGGKSLKKAVSVGKKEEEWDKDIPQVPLKRVIALNTKEWWLILLGVLGAALSGCIYPFFVFLFGEIFSVFAMERDQIRSAVIPWAGLFLLLGVVAGVGVFLKVHYLPTYTMFQRHTDSCWLFL